MTRSKKKRNARNGKNAGTPGKKNQSAPAAETQRHDSIAPNGEGPCGSGQIDSTTEHLLSSLRLIEVTVIQDAMMDTLETLSANSADRTFGALDSLLGSMRELGITGLDEYSGKLQNIVNRRVDAYTNILLQYILALKRVVVQDAYPLTEDSATITAMITEATSKSFLPNTKPRSDPRPATPNHADNATVGEQEADLKAEEKMPAVAAEPDVGESVVMPGSANIQRQEKAEPTDGADTSSGKAILDQEATVEAPAPMNHNSQNKPKDPIRSPTPVTSTSKRDSENMSIKEMKGHSGDKISSSWTTESSSQPIHSERSDSDSNNGSPKTVLDKVRDEKVPEGGTPDIEESKAECPICFKLAHLRACGRCREMHYCSRQCQLIDYPYHKQACKYLSWYTDERRLMPSYVRVLYFPCTLAVPKIGWLDAENHEGMASAIGCNPEEITRATSDEVTIGLGVKRAGSNDVEYICVSQDVFQREDCPYAKDTNRSLESVLSYENSGILPIFGNLCFMAVDPETRKPVDIGMRDIRTAFNALLICGQNGGVLDIRPQVVPCGTLALCRCNQFTPEELQWNALLPPQLVHWPMRKGWLWRSQDGKYPFRHHVLSLFRNTPIPLVVLEKTEDSSQVCNPWAFLLTLSLNFELRHWMSMKYIYSMVEQENSLGALNYLRLDLQPLIPLHLEFMQDYVLEFVLPQAAVVREVEENSDVGLEWISQGGGNNTESPAGNTYNIPETRTTPAETTQSPRAATTEKVVFRDNFLRLVQNKDLMRGFWNLWYPTRVLYPMQLESHDRFATPNSNNLINFVPSAAEIPSPLGEICRHSPAVFRKPDMSEEYWTGFFEPYRKGRQIGSRLHWKARFLACVAMSGMDEAISSCRELLAEAKMLDPDGNWIYP